MLSPTTLSTAGPGVKSRARLVTMKAMSAVAVMESQLPRDVARDAVDGAFARQRQELHVTGLAGLEARRGARRDVKPHPARASAVELQRRIGLEEMVVRADLDRTVAGVGHRQH